jgi:hypothetical protein
MIQPSRRSFNLFLRIWYELNIEYRVGKRMRIHQFGGYRWVFRSDSCSDRFVPLLPSLLSAIAFGCDLMRSAGHVGIIATEAHRELRGQSAAVGPRWAQCYSCVDI